MTRRVINSHRYSTSGGLLYARATSTHARRTHPLAVSDERQLLVAGNVARHFHTVRSDSRTRAAAAASGRARTTHRRHVQAGARGRRPVAADWVTLVGRCTKKEAWFNYVNQDFYGCFSATAVV